jgi:hypothetical protein
MLGANLAPIPILGMQGSQQKQRNKHKCCDRDERIQDLRCAISKNRAFAHVSSKLLGLVWNWLHILARHILSVLASACSSAGHSGCAVAPLADLRSASQ